MFHICVCALIVGHLSLLLQVSVRVCVCVGGGGGCGRGIKALAPQKHQLIVHFGDNKHSRRLAKSLLFQAQTTRHNGANIKK